MVTKEQDNLATQMLKVQEDYKEGRISRMENSLFIKKLSLQLMSLLDPKEPTQQLLRQAVEHNINRSEERIKLELELAKAVIKVYEDYNL